MASFPSYSVHLSAQNPTACRISGQRIWKVSGATKRAKRPLAKAGTCQVVRSACLHRWWKSDSENPKLVCLVLVDQIKVVPFCLAKNHTSGNPRTLAVAAWQPIKSNSICSKRPCLGRAECPQVTLHSTYPTSIHIPSGHLESQGQPSGIKGNCTIPVSTNQWSLYPSSYISRWYCKRNSWGPNVSLSLPSSPLPRSCTKPHIFHWFVDPSFPPSFNRTSPWLDRVPRQILPQSSSPQCDPWFRPWLPWD